MQALIVKQGHAGRRLNKAGREGSTAGYDNEKEDIGIAFTGVSLGARCVCYE